MTHHTFLAFKITFNVVESPQDKSVPLITFDIMASINNPSLTRLSYFSLLKLIMKNPQLVISRKAYRLFLLSDQSL